MTVTNTPATPAEVSVVGAGEIPTTLSQPARSVEDMARLRVESAAAAAAPAARSSGQRAESARSRRSNLGGAQLKLEVVKSSIPGFHLYWENDADSRIERLLGEGFEFVTPEEVGMVRMTNRVVADTDITDRVSKYVGTTEEGKAMRAYLMKCPDDIWEDIQHCITDVADSRDRDILESANRGGERYQPKGYETKVTSGMRR